MSPTRAFFDAERAPRLELRFRAERPVSLVVRLVDRASGRTVRRWTEPHAAPGRRYRWSWSGLRRDGRVAADSSYGFRVGPPGHRGEPAGGFSFRGHRFPVAGPHSYGDRFGEPRSGGRVHEGQDLPAPCGTPLLAARGGRVEARGYSDALYGHWVAIDTRATRADHFYSHLQAPTPLASGARVRTGERIGAVGKTGNARSEFCQLHFELWPAGHRNGRPVDPLASLRYWDSFS